MPAISDYFFRAGAWLAYHKKAGGAGSIHSPFVFEFYREVVDFPYSFSIYEKMEEARMRLLGDPSILSYEDPGAEKRLVRRSVGSLAAGSLMPFEKASLLFRLVRWLKPERMIELGTCLGLTSAYLKEGAGDSSQLYSFEAVPDLAERAEELWQNLGISGIGLVQGKIEETLPQFLTSKGQACWDFALVDANHRYRATIDAFHLLNENRAGQRACLVFDDIYWSREMAKAWKEICLHPQVSVSVDLFHLGILFFRPESSSEKFILK